MRQLTTRPVEVLMPQHVYAVHSTRPDDVGAVEVVFQTEKDACGFAQSRRTIA